MTQNSLKKEYEAFVSWKQKELKPDRIDAYVRWLTFTRDLFKLPSKEPITEWAAKNVRFDEPNNSGFFEVKGREYIIEPVEAMADWRINDVCLVFGSQTGKTSALMLYANSVCVNRNARILWVMTGREVAGTFSDTRWIPMLKASSTSSLIRGQYALKKMQQKVGGTIIDFTGSNSASGLSSTPCDIVILDETDKFPTEVRGEANAVSLAEQRVKNAPNPKRIKTSTPCLEEGLIWQEFLKGDQRRYFVPCPHCEHDLLLAWSPNFYTFAKRGCEAYVKWDAEAKIGDTWDYEAVEKSAHFECPFCKGRFGDLEKLQIIARGKWQPTAEKAGTTYRSYQLSSLYATSPSCSVGKLAVKFLKEKRSLQGLQGFVNGDLAEPWIAQEDIRKTEWIVSKDAPLGEGQWARFLTADFQALEPHLWWVCRAWDKLTGNSRLIEHGNCNDFVEFAAIQKRLGVHDTGVGIDSGFDPVSVYAECANHGVLRNRPYDPKFPWKQTRVIVGWTPMKGFGKNQGWFDEYHNPRIWGFGEARLSQKEFGIQILQFNSQILKDILERLRRRKTPEKWEIAAELDTDEYRLHLMGEVKKRKEAFGLTTYTWQKRTNNWPNHLLDCEVMQLALALKFGALCLVERVENEENLTKVTDGKE